VAPNVLTQSVTSIALLGDAIDRMRSLLNEVGHGADVSQACLSASPCRALNLVSSKMTSGPCDSEGSVDSRATEPARMISIQPSRTFSFGSGEPGDSERGSQHH
jgi:hypothetical protein